MVLFDSSEFRLAIRYNEQAGGVDLEQVSDLSAPFGGWSDSRVGIEFQWKSQPVFNGTWKTSVLHNGKKLQSRGNWTSVCEVSEPTHKYLELETQLNDGLRIQRHFLLDHAEELMILADSILPTARQFEKSQRKIRKKQTSPRQQIQYEMRIPLAVDMLAGPGEREGTDRTLFVKEKSKKKLFSHVFPLALPQWNLLQSGSEQTPEEFFGGEFAFETLDTKNTMVLRHYGTGGALFAPLFFDLSESRLRHPYLWRTLTVGENREKVPLDRAVGYRIQTHENQYILYRSLTPQRNRTLLGVNLVSDLFFGSFSPEKRAEMILELNEE